MIRRIGVRVKPGARVSALTRCSDGTWLAQVKAPPVDGKANEELCALVAREFGVHKAQVSIRRGGSGRSKLVEIDEGKVDEHSLPPAERTRRSGPPVPTD